MPKPNKGPRLGGGPAHERMLLANLAAQLFEHGSIQTTEVKAKRVQPLAEKFVTYAKRGDLHARRQVLRRIGDKWIVHLLFTEIAPLMEGREGGYTRIVKTGFRKGDNAPMAVIELVTEPVRAKAATASAAQDDEDAEEPSEAEEPREESSEAGPADAEPVDAEPADAEPADHEAEKPAEQS